MYLWGDFLRNNNVLIMEKVNLEYKFVVFAKMVESYYVFEEVSLNFFFFFWKIICSWMWSVSGQKTDKYCVLFSYRCVQTTWDGITR